jgi:hypothetical protein
MIKMLFCLLALVPICFICGCNSDIVCTDNLKKLERKCVYIEDLTTEDPSIGKVLRDVIEKEFVRKRFEICDQNNATVLISGAAFLTQQSKGSQNPLFLGGSTTGSQAIESISLIAKNNKGEILASASFDNVDRRSASKIATEFGNAVAGKLK